MSSIQCVACWSQNNQIYITFALWLHHLGAVQFWQPLTQQPAPSTWPASHCCRAGASPPGVVPLPADAGAPPRTKTAAKPCMLEIPVRPREQDLMMCTTIASICTLEGISLSPRMSACNPDRNRIGHGRHLWCMVFQAMRVTVR